MKKFKFIAFALAFICAIPLLVACGDTPTLATPKNVQVDETNYVVSWNAVENANYYYVEVNGKRYQTNQTNLSVLEIVDDGGIYNIRVGAHSISNNYKPSKYSDFVTIEYIIQFNAPVVVLDGNSLSWQAVEGAEYYVVVVNNVKIETTQTSFNLSEQSELSAALVTGLSNTIQVYVRATSNNRQSEMSNLVTVNL